ncbi:MAG: sigma-70 family RNA polymerase sigma factor [Pirellulaceae bacterium]|nr:sigma-70 family RNA polymerase sigma factor [Pirellulaceae bacterium]
MTTSNKSTSESVFDSSTTLEVLVNAAKKGDRNAFGELFTRFRDLVYGIAIRRLYSEADAQELCQDAFLQAMEKIEQLREPKAFGGWLRSITHRLAINRVARNMANEFADSENIHLHETTFINPFQSAVEREELGEMNAGLHRLGSLDRDTLISFYYEGNSLLEMSDHFEAPVGTIKRRLHVARKRLAKEVEPLLAT